MICIHSSLYVSFDENNKFRRVLPGGVEIFIPTKWTHVDDYGQKTDKMVDNIDRKEVNPQIAYVIAPNPAYPYVAGDKVFLHYLAYDRREKVQDGYVIDASDVIFYVKTGDNIIQMADDTYLAKQVFTPPPRSPLGIYLTPNSDVKEHMQCVVTHVPANDAVCEVGDTVITIDRAQYELEYEGEKYVKLHGGYIVGVLCNA